MTITQNGHSATAPATSGFGATLRTLRMWAGLSHAQLQAATGLDHSHISRLESGSRNPTRMTVLIIAAGLKLDRRDTARIMASAGFVPEGVSVEAVVALVGRQAS